MERKIQSDQDVILIEDSETCSSCNQCPYIGNKNELELHVKSKHVNSFKCHVCSYSFSCTTSLNNHVEFEHKNRQQLQSFPCEFCGLDLTNFQLLQEHVSTAHVTCLSNCNYCSFTTNTDDQLQIHMTDEHTDIAILHTVARQVNELTGKFEQIKETITKFNDYQRELETTLKNLFENQNKLNANIQDQKARNISISSEKDKKASDNVPISSYSPQVEPRPHAEMKANTSFSPKLKAVPSRILWVGDSHSYNLDRKLFEHRTDTKVDMAIAFTADKDDDAKYPDRNFLGIVPERLRKDNYDTLVLQGGCNEISNIQTNKDFNVEDVTAWQEKVFESRAKIFQLAESSLEQNKHVKNVIIVNSLPRFDPSHEDPCGIKANLNSFGNSLYSSFWMQKGCPANISIVDQKLDCAGELRTKRFGNPADKNPNGKPYDGVHMRGIKSMQHYTNSMIRVFAASFADLSVDRKYSQAVSSDNYHETCPQTLYRQRQLVKVSENMAYNAANNEYRQGFGSSERRYTSSQRFNHAININGYRGYKRNNRSSLGKYNHYENYTNGRYSVPVSNRYQGNF